jgi:glycosyltransferase involved in cell wall biosynthesis
MPPAPEIAYGLETPYPLQPSQNYLRLEGWALIRNSNTPTITRIRIDQACFDPESTPVRTDVAASHPDDPFASSAGFTFVCFLPFGNHLGLLEASADNGETWHLVKSMIIPVSSHPLLGDFEPAGIDGRLTETTRLAGWCWHPEFTIDQVVLLFGDIEVAVDFGLSRPDVVARFPAQSQSEFSGFLTCENLPRGTGKLRLQVTTTCGRVYFLDPELTATLPTGAFAPARESVKMWDDEIVENLRQSRENAPAPTAKNSAEIGSTNILFVLYGDFTSNSANHVTAFANELIARGFDCIVAVPEHMETVGAQSDARFLAIEYADLERLPSYYRDNKAPALVHAWTTRQSVDAFCSKIIARYGSQLVVHLEDNEREILARHLKLDLTELDRLSPAQLDKLTPLTLSHPLKAEKFLRVARGATIIVDQLAEFVPEGTPHRTIWPAAGSVFSPRAPNPALRTKLGIRPDDLVIFYHGNVHQANAHEVGELYQAIATLNATGQCTWLLRTGRDSAEFTRSLTPETRAGVIELGFVKRAKDLPEFMSLADFFVQPGQSGSFNDYRFPSKLPEFFALGRPVILPATNLGGEVEHGHHAYVVENADASAIVEAIRTLHQDPALTRKLTAGAREFAATQFSWSRSTDELLAFYQEVTNLGRPNEIQLSAAQSVSRALSNES